MSNRDAHRDTITGRIGANIRKHSPEPVLQILNSAGDSQESPYADLIHRAWRGWSFAGAADMGERNADLLLAYLLNRAEEAAK